jgi:hypothetical protein
MKLEDHKRRAIPDLSDEAFRRAREELEAENRAITLAVANIKRAAKDLFDVYPRRHRPELRVMVSISDDGEIIVDLDP